MACRQKKKLGMKAMNPRWNKTRRVRTITVHNEDARYHKSQVKKERKTRGQKKSQEPERHTQKPYHPTK